MSKTEPEDRLPNLILALKDPHVSVGWNAARELAKLGPSARPALPALTETMRNRDAATALWARFAAAVITGETAKHLPVFIEALSDKRVYPGMASAALAGLGAAAIPAVPALIPQLSDPNAENRWSAAWAIANIAKDAGEFLSFLVEAVPALAAALTGDADEKVRWYAAFALSEIGPDALPALPALTAALHDFDDDARGYAVRAIGRIGPPANSALPFLTALRDDETENATIRREAELAIVRLSEV